jgi:hypothetical protein
MRNPTPHWLYDLLASAAVLGVSALVFWLLPVASLPGSTS